VTKGVTLKTVANTVGNAIQLGNCIRHRGIAVAALFPALNPVARYSTLDDALERGLRVEEAGPAGSVPELVVHNPLDERVLLYDGEELLGAKQNRILNVTVLVEARTSLSIPVSCVEEGRWSDATRTLRPAPHAAYPELRRRKAECLSVDPLARGLAQAEVWDAVREKATRMHVASPTRANSDTFHAFADELRPLETVLPLEPGQSGAVLAIGESIGLDWVSRPDAFARLWPKLRRSYALDALESLDREAAGDDRIAAFVDEVVTSSVGLGPSPGLGGDLRLRGRGVVGSGLQLEDELLQLSAFTRRGSRPGRIARPSRRRL
jgi:hypothetical protein